jgi:hypothetical protein
MSTLIHMNRTKAPSPLRETRASIVRGDIEEVVRGLIAHIEQSPACVVRHTGADYTGPNGSARSRSFEVTVTLDGHEPMVWEHIVTEPGETWKRAPTNQAPSNDAAAKHEGQS